MARWNWKPDPSKVVIIDLETQSTRDLKKITSREYIRDSTTRLLSLVAKFRNLIIVWVPDGRYPAREWGISPGDVWPDGITRSTEAIMLCGGNQPPADLIDWINTGYTFVAHNAGGFDCEAFRVLVAEKCGCPEPAAWYDTFPICRAAGYPGSLNAVSEIFFKLKKDEKGQKASKMLWSAKVRNDEVIYPLGTVPLWRMALQYNVMDVLLLDRLFPRLLGSEESEVLDVHMAINARGVHFDGGFLAKLKDLWVQVKDLAVDEIAELTGGELTRDMLRSIPKMKKWLGQQGLNLDSLNRQVLERLYDFPEEFFDGIEPDQFKTSHALVCAVLQMRQAVTRVGEAKLERLAGMADDDGRLRDVHVYSGAHTGRFSSRGVQTHNMARGVGDLDVEGLLTAYHNNGLTLEAVRAAAARCKNTPRVDDILSTLFRPVFDAAPGKRLLIADYAAIEARCLAWLAGEAGLLDAFSTGADIYCEMASRIYGRKITKANKNERQVGKITVLGCGYSMSANKFAVFCKAMKIDLAAAGVTAEQCVESYRNTYPLIAGIMTEDGYRTGGLWRTYQKAAFRAIERGGVVEAGRCKFYELDSNLHIKLPSGRDLVYRGARIENCVPRYAAAFGLDSSPKPTLLYQHHHGYSATLYGGLLTENIDQATCRDLLCAALIECERDGLSPVLHVHDEIVCEVDSADEESSLACLVENMSYPPEWAAGFPIAVEGFSNSRYTKSPFSDSFIVEARNGEVLNLERYK